MSDFIAGLVSSVVNISLLYPLDSLKTRLQTNNQYRNIFHCALTVCRKEGIKALYQGMSTVLMMQPLCTSVLFTVNGSMKKWMKKIMRRDILAGKEFAVCGAVSGMISAVMYTPVELVKIKMQLRNKLLMEEEVQSKIGKYSGTVDCFRKIYQNKGAKGLFFGLHLTMVRDIPSTAVWISSYEYVRHAISGSNPPIYVNMFAGVCAGTSYWIFAYPVDLIKTRIQYDESGKAFDHAKKLFQTAGFRGFYKGFSATILRTIPASAILFGTYQKTADILDSLFRNK